MYDSTIIDRYSNKETSRPGSPGYEVFLAVFHTLDALIFSEVKTTGLAGGLDSFQFPRHLGSAPQRIVFRKYNRSQTGKPFRYNSTIRVVRGNQTSQ